jgi:hypothetical protein
MIDAIAREPQFFDHMLPIWLALPKETRGSFYVGTTKRGQGVDGVVWGSAPKSPNPTLTASAGDLKRARQLGRNAAIMEHGCGQSFGGDPKSANYSSYAGGNGRDASLFLHPGNHPASRDRARYPAARVEVVGCPKLDALPAREGGGPPTVAFSWHWNCHVAPETRCAVDAFRGQVERLVKSGEFNVIGHGHPRIIDKLHNWYRKMGIETVRSFEEVCRRADVYVNDASSTLFEFASTGRPVVVMNGPMYRRKVDHGLRFWEASTVGVQIAPWDDLAGAIREALADSPAQKAAREAALDIVYDRRPGAAQRAVDTLVDWAA